jgi:KRAB domain-containing zinc finger protein
MPVFKMSRHNQDIAMKIKTEKVEIKSEPEAAAAIAPIETMREVKIDSERQWLQCLNNDEIKKEPLGRTCEKCGRFTMVKNHKCDTRCKICDKKLTTKSHLIRHMLNVHRAEPGCEFFEYDFCGLRFVRKSFLIKHLKLKHEGGKIEEFQCDYDEKIFTSKSSLYCHMKNCHRAASNCKVCGKVVKDMKHHIKMMHPVEKTTIACKICNKTFNNKELLTRHLKTHNKQFECRVCKLRYPTAYHLKVHLKIHDNLLVFQCKICSKSFNYAMSLMIHVKTHEKTREKSHQCEHCDYATDNKQLLKNHLKVHDKYRIKNLKCPKCEFATDTKSVIQRHIEIHNPHRAKFICPHCDHKLTSKTNLKIHIARKHDKKK